MTPIERLSPPQWPSPTSTSTPQSSDRRVSGIRQRALQAHTPATPPPSRPTPNLPSPRKRLGKFPIENKPDLPVFIQQYYLIASKIEEALEGEQPDPNLELQLWSVLIHTFKKCLQYNLDPTFWLLLNLKLIYAMEQCLEFEPNAQRRNNYCSNIIEKVEHCLALKPDKPNVRALLYGSLAFAHSKQEHYKPAITAALEGLEQSDLALPLRMQLYFELAIANAGLTNNLEVIKLTEKYLQCNDDDRSIFIRSHLLASCFNKMRLFTHSCKCALDGLSEESDLKIPLYIELAKGLIGLKKYEKAIKTIEKGLLQHPSDEEKEQLHKLKGLLNKASNQRHNKQEPPALRKKMRLERPKSL